MAKKKVCVFHATALSQLSVVFARRTSGHGVAPEDDLPLDLHSCSDIL